MFRRPVMILIMVLNHNLLLPPDTHQGKYSPGTHLLLWVEIIQFFNLTMILLFRLPVQKVNGQQLLEKAYEETN